MNYLTIAIVSSALLCSTSGVALAQNQSFVFGQETESEGFSFGSSEIDTMDVGEQDAQSPKHWKFNTEVDFGAGYLPYEEANVDVSTHARITPELTWRGDNRFSAKFSGEIAHFSELGSRDSNDVQVLYQDNYVRYTDDNLKLTAGPQKIIWGSTDEIKPTDRIGAQNFSQGIIRDYADRQLAVPAVRGEYVKDGFKFDGVGVFKHRNAELAEEDSMWSFINRNNGRVLGVPNTPEFASIVQQATIDEESYGFGGGGARISKKTSLMDGAVTLQRVRQTTPFYDINPQISAAVEAGSFTPTTLSSLSGATATIINPWTWVMGGDVSIPIGASIFRGEVAWLSDVPVHSQSFRRRDANNIQAVAGVEFYPGDTDFRVIVQSVANVLYGVDNMLEQDEQYSLNGSFENPFLHGDLVASLDYGLGINEHDVYINPKLSYRGIDNHDLYVEGHFFDGSDVTVGGFYEDNSQVRVGWSYEFGKSFDLPKMPVKQAYTPKRKYTPKGKYVDTYVPVPER